MSGSGNIGRGLEALLRAAEFLEEQDKQKLENQSNNTIKCGEKAEKKLTVYTNGFHPSSFNQRRPPLPKYGSVIRAVHNKLEKNRRAHLQECFKTLEKQLPPSPDEKRVSSLGILRIATRYIAVLKQKEKEFERDMEKLASEKIGHQQRLAALKKELMAQGSHIDLDTLLPEAVGPDPHRTSDFLTNQIQDVGNVAQNEVLQVEPQVQNSSVLTQPNIIPVRLQSESNLSHTQIVNSSLLKNPIQLLLPSTTIRVRIPNDTQFLQTHVTTNGANGVTNQGTVTLVAKQSTSTVPKGVTNQATVILATQQASSAVDNIEFKRRNGGEKLSDAQIQLEFSCRG